MSNNIHKYSNNNSTFITLQSNESFIGTVENCSNYETIHVDVYSDVDSSNCGLKVYFGLFSENNYDFTISYTIYGGISKNLIIPIKGRYYKIIYINGNSQQTVFRLQTFLSINNNIETIVKFNDTILDNFGKLRTSNMYPLLDCMNIFEKNYFKEDEYITGTGVINNPTNAMLQMTVSGIGRAIRQSRIYTTYQPGKSFLIYLTGVIKNSNNDPNIYCRLGYYDENDGIYFESYNDTIYLVIRNSSSGSVIDTKVPQNEWNVDPMNGTGSSGINIDFTKFLIYSINFSWLGAGVVRFGIFYSGQHYIVHTFRHNNINSPYMKTPNLPVRYEIKSDGAYSGELLKACYSVNSEDGYDLIGNIFSIGNNSKAISKTNTYIMAIRLKPNSHKLVRLQNITLMCSTKGDVQYGIYLSLSPNSDIVTDSNWTNITNSYVQYDISGTAVNSSNSILLYQGYFSTLINIETRRLSDSGDPIYLTNGIDIDTHRTDYLFIVAKSVNQNSETIYTTLNWIEI